MLFVLKIIMYGLAGYLSFYSLYWFLSTFLGMCYRPQKPEVRNHSNPNMLIILPAYKPGKIFHRVAICVNQAIHGRNVRVYILLQEAEPGYRKAMEKLGFWVEEATFSHLNGNSYHHALKHIVKQISSFEEHNNWKPDFVMLVDKDNLLDEDFFENITPDDYAQYDVIQGRRCSINAKGEVSFFDTVSESLNDTMFRSAKSLFKSIIEISGSGALIRTEIFKDAINRLDPKAPGYDKNFMVQILTRRQKVRTLFLPYVKLYEEKTDEMDSYNPQRVRWFGEQYYNAVYSSGKLLKAFVSLGRFSALEYLIALWRPPRSVHILLVPALGLLEIASYVWNGSWWLDFPFFTASTFTLGLATMFFLAKEKLLLKALRHIFSLPKLAFSNAKNAAASMKKENHGKFIHTQHKM
jgi:hypothetical protein